MNLLITGAWEQAQAHIESIEKRGHHVRYLQYEKDALPCDYDWVEGVIGNGLFLFHPIEKFHNLKYIQLTSAGLDRVPIDYVKERNIKIFNAKGVYSIPIAEFVLGGVLQIYKQSRYFNDNQKTHKWEKHRGLLELNDRNVCIIGCGSVGNACAKRFNAFECTVTGVDINPYPNELYDTILPIDSLDDALMRADIVVLTLPLNEMTRHLINANRLAIMKRGSVLVNVARGTIVDTDALITALKAQLGGAVLDVFEDEPLNEGSPLWDMTNVIITPHNSFVGTGNSKRMSAVIMSNLERLN